MELQEALEKIREALALIETSYDIMDGVYKGTRFFSTVPGERRANINDMCRETLSSLHSPKYYLNRVLRDYDKETD